MTFVEQHTPESRWISVIFLQGEETDELLDLIDQCQLLRSELEYAELVWFLHKHVKTNSRVITPNGAVVPSSDRGQTSTSALVWWGRSVLFGAATARIRAPPSPTRSHCFVLPE